MYMWILVHMYLLYRYLHNRNLLFFPFFSLLFFFIFASFFSLFLTFSFFLYFFLIFVGDSEDDSDIGECGEDGEEDDGKCRKTLPAQRWLIMDAMKFINCLLYINLNVIYLDIKLWSYTTNLKYCHISWLFCFTQLLFPCSAKAKNREHAKNTRTRKKHYIETLKETLKQLSTERDAIDSDRRIALSRMADQVCFWSVFVYMCLYVYQFLIYTWICIYIYVCILIFYINVYQPFIYIYIYAQMINSKLIFQIFI